MKSTTLKSIADFSVLLISHNNLTGGIHCPTYAYTLLLLPYTTVNKMLVFAGVSIAALEGTSEVVAELRQYLGSTQRLPLYTPPRCFFPITEPVVVKQWLSCLEVLFV